MPCHAEIPIFGKGPYGDILLLCLGNIVGNWFNETNENLIIGIFGIGDLISFKMDEISQRNGSSNESQPLSQESITGENAAGKT